MATITVIYDPQDRVAFRPTKGNDDIKFASLRVAIMDKLDIAMVTRDLTANIVAQLQKDN